MSQKHKHVVDGMIQVPLPDDPAARAKAFGEVAAAWSQFLSAIDHLLPEGEAAGGRLKPGAAAAPLSPIRPYVATPSAESMFAQGYQQGLSEAEAVAAARTNETPVSSVPAGSNGASASVPVNGTEKPAAKAKSVPSKRGTGSNHSAAHMEKMREAKAKAARARRRAAR